MLCFFGLLCCFNIYSIRCEENNVYTARINEFSEIVQKYNVHKEKINSEGLESIVDFLKYAFFEINNYDIELTVVNETMIRINVYNNEALLANLTFFSHSVPLKSAVGMYTKVVGELFIYNKSYEIFLGHERDNKFCLMFFDRNDESHIYINYFYPNEREMYIEEKYTNTEYFLETSELLEVRIIYKRRCNDFE
jgi:hypothetical protein